MKKITLVRHGETYQNHNHTVQGSDPTQGRLTPKGLRQAELLGMALAGWHFDLVYCSPLERAVLTMSQLLVPRKGERTLPILFPGELMEVNLGVLHGCPHAEWKAAINGDPMAFRPEGGESWLDVQARVTAYLREVIFLIGSLLGSISVPVLRVVIRIPAAGSALDGQDHPRAGHAGWLRTRAHAGQILTALCGLVNRGRALAKPCGGTQRQLKPYIEPRGPRR